MARRTVRKLHKQSMTKKVNPFGTCQSDLDQLFPTDDPIVVDVVEGESPLQLVLRRPLRDDGEELHEVPERYAASPIPANGCRVIVKAITMERGPKEVPQS